MASAKSGGGNYFRNLRGSMGELLRTEFWSILPTFGFDALAQWGQGLDIHFASLVMAGLISVFGDSILRSNDKQQFVSRFIATFLPPNIQRPFQIVLEELIEEAAKRQNEFSGTPAENKVKARQVLQAALQTAAGKVNMASPAPAAAPAAAPTAPAAAPAAVAVAPAAAPATAPAPAPAAAPAPQPKPAQDRNVLHLVGTLRPNDQDAFWDIVADAQSELNQRQLAELAAQGRTLQPGQPLAGEEVIALINRVSLSKEQLLAVIGAPTAELQCDALLDALRRATSAGGTGSAIGRVWDRTMRMVEQVLPSGGTTSSPLGDMRETNARRKKEDDDVSDFR